MKYFDLCLRAVNPKVLAVARELGFSGVGVLGQAGGDFSGVELQTLKGVEKSGGFDIVAVNSSSPEVTRQAVESKVVNVVFCRELDYVMARLAKRNSVAIGFDFSEALHSFGKRRSQLLADYSRIAALVRKYKSPFLLTSGARSAWDLRGPSDLVAFGRVLGLDKPELGLTDNIPMRKAAARKGIMPGVEMV